MALKRHAANTTFMQVRLLKLSGVYKYFYRVLIIRLDHSVSAGLVENEKGMNERLDVRIRLSAQRALWGQVPASPRAVSIDVDEQRIYFRYIFDGEPTEYDWELVSVAATEIITDFHAPYTIKEEYLSVEMPNRMEHLRYLIYLRQEKASKNNQQVTLHSAAPDPFLI